MLFWSANLRRAIGCDARGSDVNTSDIEVRWARSGDSSSIDRLLEASKHKTSQKHTIVVEERGVIVAALRSSVRLRALVLEEPAVDACAAEYRLLLALYASVSELARQSGLKEVWSTSDSHREYLLDNGYCRYVGGWRLDVPSRGP